ncbi:MAG: hypothetical protein FWB87_15870 [Defluviitaleaceae bacterium]|nr:hypothetical protein [Defluviitaleaceae bacterium]MCL2263939.1 hypothetical protein [Defluviitaleaceae bacterium]
MNETILQKYISTGALYEILELDNIDFADLKRLHNGNFIFDAFCLKCQSLSTFKSNYKYNNQWKEKENLTLEDNRREFLRFLEDEPLSFECARDFNHTINIVLKTEPSYSIDSADSIQKYGQYPSLDETITSSLVKYNEFLPNDSRELGCAIKLNNNGKHIGAFVYLRRIFERQIFSLFEENILTLNIERDDFYKKKKMEQKIDILRNYLPQFVVDNKKVLYPLLSKGVHEWTEVECSQYFHCVYQSIEIILDRIVAVLEMKEKEIKLTDEISIINQQSGKV